MRWEAWRRTRIDALGDGREAWVDIALGEAVDVLLRRFVCVLEILRNLVERAIPPGVAATVHDGDDDSDGSCSVRFRGLLRVAARCCDATAHWLQHRNKHITFRDKLRYDDVVDEMRLGWAF